MGGLIVTISGEIVPKSEADKYVDQGKLVRPERFELPTYSSGGCRSIQLSYGRTPVFPVYMRSFTLSIGGSKVIVTL
jgi:hypothetical protein